jgi:hypothetical protein
VLNLSGPRAWSDGTSQSGVCWQLPPSRPGLMPFLARVNTQNPFVSFIEEDIEKFGAVPL